MANLRLGETHTKRVTICFQCYLSNTLADDRISCAHISSLTGSSSDTVTGAVTAESPAAHHNASGPEFG